MTNTTVYDLIQLAGNIPVAGETLTLGKGGLVTLVEPVTFTTALDNQVATGDTAVIGGVTYTVSAVSLSVNNYTISNGDGGTTLATATTTNISLTSPLGGTVSYMVPFDQTNGDHLFGITEVSVLFASPPPSDLGPNLPNIGADGIVSLAVNVDPVSGAAIGTNVISGTAGDDIINLFYTGDPEGDRIDNNDNAAGNNDDIVEAGAGNDLVIGRFGNDLIFGGTGDDTVSGAEGSDTVFGGAGNDQVIGDSAGSVVNDSNDVLFGGDGNDLVSGGIGNDTLSGDFGNDTLLGGNGDDTFILNDGWGVDTITGGEAAETRGDTLDAGNLTDNATLDLSANGVNNPESGTITSGFNQATFTQIESFALGSGSDSVIGSAGADSVDAGSGADTIDGGAGNDTFNLGSILSTTDGSADIVVFSDGDGNDTLTNFEGPVFNAGTGTFTSIDKLDVSGLTNAAGNPVDTADVIVMTDINGNTVLAFPNGESLTLPGVALSQVDSTAELVAMGIPAVPLNFIVEGTAGNDLIDINYTGDPEGDMIDANDNAAGNNDDIVITGNGNDTVFSGLGNDSVEGGLGLDTLFGGSGNDTLAGGLSNDSLSGGTGNDRIFGGDGADRIDGGANDDALFGDAGDDFIIGGSGNDRVFGGTGNDAIFGGVGNDTLVGGIGRDELGGDIGDDTIDLGRNLAGDGTDLEADIVIFADGEGNDTLLNFDVPIDNGDGTFTGIDTLDVSSLTDALGDAVNVADVTVSTDVNGDAVLTFPNGETLTFVGVSANQINDPLELEAIGIPLPPASTQTIFDMIQLSVGTAPQNGDILFAGVNDDLIEVDEPVTFTTILPGQILIGDTAVIGGVTYTVTSTQGGTGDFTHKNSGVDEIVSIKFGIITLENGSESPITYIVPIDAAGDIPRISQIEITSIGANDFFLTTTNADTNDLVTLLCFAGGTKIETVEGHICVEDLHIGQMVQTMDHGLQPIRWIGQRTVAATGKHAPIVIKKGAMGNARDLRVSPQHRMLMQGWHTEMLFGETKVLAAAKHLENGHTIYAEEGGTVEYFHILFDRHEVIYAEGALSESFHPGEMTANSISKTSRDMLFAIRPELKDNPDSYGAAAYTSLRSYEARLLAHELFPKSIPLEVKQQAREVMYLQLV